MTESSFSLQEGKRRGMKQLKKKCGSLLVLLFILALAAGVSAAASADNSLADLGITTEGVTVEPAFQYDIWTYDVTVPTGTTELSLNPTPSSGVATISSVNGTTLDENGNGTVYITVKAESGSEFTYTLNVKADGDYIPVAQPAETEPETQPQTQAPQTEAPTEAAPQTEAQTEDSRFVRVDKNTIQEAENTITGLKGEITKYRDTISLYTKIMYGLIGLSVVLLFALINLILRKKDLKAELNEYRSLGYGRNDKDVPPVPDQWQNPANMQGRSMQNIDNRATPPQYYTPAAGNLDVMPQTSQGRGRKLPEYEQPAPAASKQAPPKQAAPAATPAAPASAAAPGAPAPAAPAPSAAAPAAPAPAAQKPAASAQPVKKPDAPAPAAPQQNAPAAPAAGQAGVPQGRPQGAPQNVPYNAPVPENQDVEIDMIDL